MLLNIFQKKEKIILQDCVLNLFKKKPETTFQRYWYQDSSLILGSKGEAFSVKTTFLTE